MDTAAPEQLDDQRSDDQRLDALYRGHAGEVYRYSLSLVRDPAEAEDVTQATFLNAVEAFREHPPRKPRQWLMAIARNVCLDRQRQAQRRPQLVTLHEVEAAPEEDMRVRADEIVSALSGLPSRQRAALLLAGLEGRSRSEIAAELDIEEQTVGNLLTRARHNLRLQLDEGMTCERARAVAPSPRGDAPTAERRAAIAHLRHCEHCAQAVKPRSLAGALLTLWSLLRYLPGQAARLAPETGGLARLAAVAEGGSFLAKAAVLVTVGTVAGGVAWHETGRGAGSASTADPSRATGERPSATFAPRAVADAGAAPIVVATARYAPATPRAQDTKPGRSAGKPATSVTRPAAGSAPAIAPAPAASETLPDPAPPAVVEPDAPATAGQATGPTLTQESSGPAADPPGTRDEAVVTSGQQPTPPSQATASGQVDNPGQGNAGGNSATAPGQANNPGQGNQSNAGGNSANAPGQINNPDQGNQGNAGGNSANAPGQANNPGQGNAGGNSANAPGQANNPGQGNAGGNSANAPGQGNQGNAGGNSATAPGQIDNPGQGNAGGNAAQGNAGDNSATAPGQTDNPGQGNQGNAGGNSATAPGQTNGPGQGNPGSNSAAAPGKGDASSPGNGNGNGSPTSPLGQTGNSPGKDKPAAG